MGNMRFKVGDRVRIKSLDWYNANKDEYGYIDCGSRAFFTKMSNWCGKIATIKEVCKTNCYLLEEYDFDWTDEMIEGLVPEPKFKVGDILFYRGETSGYLKVEEIREENGEIRYYETSRNIYLVENDPDVFADKVCSVETEETKPIYFTIKTTDTKGKVEVVIPDGYGYEIENDKLYFITKKKEYPKTYEECCKVLGLLNVDLCFNADYRSFDASKEQWKRLGLMNQFYQLLICRDAYWKIAGEEMGLGKPWEPDYKNPDIDLYVIINIYNRVEKAKFGYGFESCVFTFPTEEMRDAFYENFKELIESCKELL